MPFAYRSMQGESLQFDRCFRPIFQSLCNHGIFIKLNLPMLLVMVKQWKRSQKYFDLSTLNHSYPCITHGAINFLKWELLWISR